MTPLELAEAALLGVPVGLALGLVGGGGSILTVPILIGVLGVSPHLATSASLVIVSVNAGGALWTFAKERLVRCRVALTLVASGVLGTIVGTQLNQQVPPHALTLDFAALMVSVALAMLRGEATQTRASLKGAVSPVKSPVKLFVTGTLVGLTTGFFGVGGGFVIVPALVYLGLDMRQAVPTSLLIIILNSLLALSLRAASGVPLGYALPMIAGGFVGTSLAVRLAPKLDNVGLTRTFALLVLALAGYLAWTLRGSYA